MGELQEERSWKPLEKTVKPSTAITHGHQFWPKADESRVNIEAYNFEAWR